MSVHQRVEQLRPSVNERPALSVVVRTARPVALALFLLLATVAVRAGVPSPQQERRARLVMATGGWTFDITGWMIGALRDKAEAAFYRPAAHIDDPTGSAMVRAYLARAAEIRDLEADIEALFAGAHATSAQITALQHRVDGLRADQEAAHTTVEQIIERQVGAELVRRGLGFGGTAFPPVQFTFVEPPKKLVVSPRERIATVHYRMLRPTFGTADAEATERIIGDQFDLSAYVTQIGGMGAYPAMVVDRASLPWVLSTVAHEWTHNYLTLFPLGLSYNLSPQLTTINETVAEIVGNEVGAAVLARHYPDLVPPDEAAGDPMASEVLLPPSGPTPFDFRTEMRRTRLTVDRLLALGRVEDAERYMEQRRRVFVDNGYPIRKLNQAYFAFHGSYGTSAASTDPLVPLLFQLREASDDTRSFLRAVRGITSADALTARLTATGQ